MLVWRNFGNDLSLRKRTEGFEPRFRWLPHQWTILTSQYIAFIIVVHASTNYSLVFIFLFGKYKHWIIASWWRTGPISLINCLHLPPSLGMIGISPGIITTNSTAHKLKARFPIPMELGISYDKMLPAWIRLLYSWMLQQKETVLETSCPEINCLWI